MKPNYDVVLIYKSNPKFSLVLESGCEARLAHARMSTAHRPRQPEQSVAAIDDSTHRRRPAIPEVTRGRW